MYACVCLPNPSTADRMLHKTDFYAEYSLMARETQRIKKWYLMPLCLTLSIIRYGSRVKWVNPGKEIALSPTPWCSSYQKGILQVTLDYDRQLYLLYSWFQFGDFPSPWPIFIPRLRMPVLLYYLPLAWGIRDQFMPLPKAHPGFESGLVLLSIYLLSFSLSVYRSVCMHLSLSLSHTHTHSLSLPVVFYLLSFSSLFLLG